ncbi:MAG: glycerophosphodiester phosphodiesterase [Candidatus Heimdallarchaeota archaeon]|nr:glycerophosphodiester phosphodiesterase [Candidatus Heimdallarchaeota archaeon]
MKLPMIFGHRGASSSEPENTMRAFIQAFQDGADGIEFDVRLTADNQMVVIHDSLINRTSNGFGLVRKKTYQELLGFDFGKGEKIPLLEDVLKKFGNKKWLNIEIKEQGFEEQLLEMLDKLEINQKFVISSFEISVLEKIKELNSEIPTAFLYQTIRFNLQALISKIQCDGLHPKHTLVNRRLFSEARYYRLAIRAWTVDSKRKAWNLTKLGIHGIITNNPKKLLLYLKEKQQKINKKRKI